VSVHSKSRALRLIHAVAESSRGSLDRPKGTRQFLRNWLGFPIQHSASRAVEGVPTTTFPEFLPLRTDINICLTQEMLRRHAWNVRLDEQIFIGLAIQCLNAKRIFEIGTFNGETTRYMAEAAGPEAQVFTLDLPPDEFDSTQGPQNFTGTQVGEKYRNSPVSHRITQLLGDSTTFDYSPYIGRMDFVFVDAAHDYRNGLPDSRTALRLVRPGGVIFWHDFVPFWSGLVHGVIEGTRGHPLKRLAGTTFAVLQAGP
jgi:predicted O-methyltransferase YrrM